MWCQKSVFKSSPHFIQSVKQKVNSDLVFTHFWSGFSFFFIHSKLWNLFRSVIFDAISHNGKRLCEVRGFLALKFNRITTAEFAQMSNRSRSTPHFAKPMLYAVCFRILFLVFFLLNISLEIL